MNKGDTQKDGLEIERRFLIKEVPASLITKESMKALEVDHMHIVQFYVPGGERFRCEIRTSGCTYVATRKTAVPGRLAVREEERLLGEEEFLESIAAADRYIHKRRLSFLDGPVKWDLDFFDFYLAVAEAEMPEEDHKLLVPAPVSDVLLAEITDKKGMSNYKLAKAVDDPVSWFLSERAIAEEDGWWFYHE
jgi:CYTH domain-containing protein